MNNAVYYDAQVSDELRRQMLFDGQLFVYSPRPSAMAPSLFAINHATMRHRILWDHTEQSRVQKTVTFTHSNAHISQSDPRESLMPQPPL